MPFTLALSSAVLLTDDILNLEYLPEKKKIIQNLVASMTYCTHGLSATNKNGPFQMLAALSIWHVSLHSF